MMNTKGRGAMDRTINKYSLRILFIVVCAFLFLTNNAFAELIWDNSPAWMASTSVTSFAVRSGDIDNDGDPDLVQADYYGQILIYYADAGHLPSTPTWTSSDPAGHFFDVHLADMDGDGFLDIVATK